MSSAHGEKFAYRIAKLSMEITCVQKKCPTTCSYFLLCVPPLCGRLAATGVFVEAVQVKARSLVEWNSHLVLVRNKAPLRPDKFLRPSHAAEPNYKTLISLPGP